MPIPKPRTGEKQGEFVSRCIGTLADLGEFEQEQRVAICHQQWRDRKKEEEMEKEEERTDVADASNTSSGVGRAVAGYYEEVPPFPEDFEMPKSPLEQLEDELKLP